MLSTSDRKVVASLARRVRERFQGARIWAFGSRVRGDATWESDLDVCVVFDHLDPKVEKTLSDIAWETGFENGLVFNTIAFARDDFEHGPASDCSLVAAILREGVPV